MKKIVYVSLAALALGLNSCSNEEDFQGSATQAKDVIKAEISGKSTKTAMNGNTVLWEQGDEIGVIVTNNTNGSSQENKSCTLSSGAGTNNAEFTIFTEQGDTRVAAYYPYGDGVTYDVGSKVLSLTMPDSYTYDAAKPNHNNKAPMACLINTGSQSLASFKNAGALMHITLENIPQDVNKITLTSANSDAPIAGAATITFDEVGNPKLAIPSTEANKVSDAASTGHTITVHFTNATDKSTKDFYFPLPVANYSKLTLAVEKSNETGSSTIKTKALNAEAGTRYTTVVSFDAITGDIPTVVENVSGATDALATNNSISIAEVPSTEQNPTISLPQVENTKPDVPVNISFDKISTSNAIVINQASEGTSVAKEVRVAVPATSADGEQSAPKVTINLPNSTVTLAANGETATYDKVEATTADNTLIVNSGVTIKTLDVKKGNIRLKANAKIEAITNSTNDTVKLIVEDKTSSYPDLEDKKIAVVGAAVADMQEVFAKGGTYTLESDVTGDFVISGSSVTLNLNGHKVTNKSDDTFIVNNGSTLIIDGNGTVDNISHAKACIYNNGTVILNGGTYIRSKETGESVTQSGSNSFYNILNHGGMTINRDVTVSQGGHFSSMIANGYRNYASEDARKGYVEGTNQAAPSLTINGGTFTGGLNTVKNDDGAELTIVDGTFTNMSQATVQNHHVTEIKGGTFNVSESASYAVDNEGHKDDSHDLGDMTISGGMFKGEIYSVGEGATLVVTGGTFSDPNVLQYLGAKADVKIAMTGNKTTPGFITSDGQIVEIDMGGDTLTLGNPTVGSTGTVTNSCQLKKGSAVTFRNGTLVSTNEKIVIQNYCKLLLEDMTLTTPNTECSISNNNESCTLNNVTINAKSDGTAFDVFYWSKNGYVDGVTVTVKGKSVINGNVEFGGLRKDGDTTKKGKLLIESGTINGNLTVTEGYYNSESPNIVLSKGVQFGNGVSGWDAYKAKN